MISREFLLKCADPLNSAGQLDTAAYYSVVAEAQAGFLKDKLLAVKNSVPALRFPLIKRGSKEKPLFVGQLAEAVDEKFLKLRREVQHLDGAKSKLTAGQANVWNYFLPRKYNELFYATNGERPGGEIERIFFDLDRGEKVSHEQAREAAASFVEVVKDDGDFQGGVGKKVKKIQIAWTGSSFHIYLLLHKPEKADFYVKFFQYSKNNPVANFTGRWAEKCAKITKIKVSGGHEKIADAIVIDPSQTPSGKLARTPLGCLHLRDAKTIDGVSLPLTERVLQEKNLTKTLKDYTPKQVLEELPMLAKRLI